MDRRQVLVSTGIALSVPLAGCSDTTTAGEEAPPERPWSASEPVDDPDGVHDLVVENHTDTTRPAWVRVVREDGAAVVDGRYELPDGRGIEFPDVAAWETAYTVELAVDGEEVRRREWETTDCGSDPDGAHSGGSRSATLRIEAPPDGEDQHRVSIHVDQCDAVVGPTLPTGPAAGFRLDG